MNFGNTLSSKNVLVIGLGISGRAATEFLLSQNSHVWGVDKSIDTLRDSEEVANLRHKGLKTCNETDFTDFSTINLVIASPGVSQNHPLITKAHQAGIEVIGEVELACRFIKNPIVGVTGTNGKTTVTLLITHILNFNGIKASALGNVGVPLTAELLNLNNANTNKIIIAELSSFQLDSLQAKILDLAVILNITPDHLDRYSSMDAYAKSKIHIKDCLKADGKLYIEENAYNQFGSFLDDFKPNIYGYAPTNTVYVTNKNLVFKENIDWLLPLEYRGLISHDLENIMAAFGICREMGITPAQFFDALPSFQKPHHRIEFVSKINEISYYDDSKGTNVDAVIRAVESLKGNIILIAGGVDKGSSYIPWLNGFKGKVKHLYAIGQSSAKIEQELGKKLSVTLCQSLEEAVHLATEKAEKNESVLLSPGCSSYDMFRDYVHRGNEFQKIVNALHASSEAKKIF